MKSINTLRPVHQRIPKRDKIIQETDTDALSSKYSAYRKKYLDDPFIEILVRQTQAESSTASKAFVNKLPLINRGTYVRNKSIDLLLEEFAKTGERKQIISLGSGSDTRPFHVLDKYPDIIYHEIDFAVSTSRKVRAILGNEELTRRVGKNVSSIEKTDELHTEKYHLHALDLRTLAQDSGLLPHMDSSLETLVISECCLCYLEPAQSEMVINWLVASFTKGLGIVLYEPISKNDSFGEIMIHNLAQRGISLPTLTKYPTLQSQIERLKTHGFQWAYSADVHTIHDRWLEKNDRKRIDGLEFLDEREEMNLLLQHYCVVWGGTSNLLWKSSYSKLT
jgi:[phosphatase 2A protein]-leucine-carboxy methyltransferase